MRQHMQDPKDLTLTLDARTLDYVATCIQQHAAAAASIAQAESQRVLQLIGDQVNAQRQQPEGAQTTESPEGREGAAGLLNGSAGESHHLTQ
jgi:hypothetical protein